MKIKRCKRKFADRKAQIRKALVPLTGLICRFLRWCLSPEHNLTHNFVFLFPIVFGINSAFLVFAGWAEFFPPTFKNVRIRPNTIISGYLNTSIKSYNAFSCQLSLAVNVFINDTIFIGKHFFSYEYKWNSFWMMLKLAEAKIKVPAKYNMGTLTMVVGLQYYHERLLTYQQGKSFSLCGWIFDSI